MKCWPPTIYLSAEFDNFDEIVRLDFIPRMKKCGRLLEFISYPGVTHAFMYDHSFKRTAEYWEDMQKIKQNYIMQ